MVNARVPGRRDHAAALPKLACKAHAGAVKVLNGKDTPDARKGSRKGLGPVKIPGNNCGTQTCECAGRRTVCLPCQGANGLAPAQQGAGDSPALLAGGPKDKKGHAAARSVRKSCRSMATSWGASTGEM